jgi:hypothetical protein
MKSVIDEWNVFFQSRSIYKLNQNFWLFLKLSG